MMNPLLFKEKDLPLEDLAAVGLAAGDRVFLPEADLTALLSGRRTDMLTLEDLEYQGLRIGSLQAKLSLATGPDGKPELLVHPIYLRSIPPTYLSDTEIEALESGEESCLEKDIVDKRGQRKRVLVEFDNETRQFLETDEDKLEAPEEINGYPLTAEQKAKFRRGEEVEVPDGTKARHSATTREGIRANRIALILSIVLDGGISYLVFKSLKALPGQKHGESAALLSPAFVQTEAKAKTQANAAEPELLLAGNQHMRAYTRTGSR